MNVLTDLDPVRLESELLRRIDAVHAADLGSRCLVLTPTARLAAHVQLRLIHLRPAWVGLEVHNFHSLARRIIEQGGSASIEPLSDRLLDALLRGVVSAFPENPWTRFVGRRPGALPRIRGALNELREAGLSPKIVEACLRNEAREAALAELYEAYCGKLRDLRRRGWSDRAGLVQAARRDAAAYGARFRSIFVHGAYEMIGIHIDLLRELERIAEVTILLPGSPNSPAASFSREFADQFLDQAVQSLGGPVGGRPALEALYDEDALPQPAAAEHFRFRHARGESAEVMIAVREALAAIGDGCPPSEIVIAARDLGPYSAALEEALDGEQLPWTSSLTAPLRRQPAVHDFLLLLKIVRDDFPRRATAELLRSSRVRWSELLPQGAWLRGDRADVWSRRARIIGGLEEWSRDLPEWAARPILFRGQGEEEIAEAERRADDRVEVTRTIAHALSALGDRVAAEPRTWAAHARQLSELVDGPRSLIAWRDDAASTAARAALADLIDEMGRLDLLLEPDRPVPFDEVLRWLEETVDSFEQPLHRKDNGGIRVLDATQLRGITCNQLHFLGLNSGRFPRIAREDPILPDSARARLRTRSGRPLSVKKQGGREERLLLALILGAARERVDVSWQRADESGKAKTPSLALREVARIALGSPDFLPLRERESEIARHLRSHPAQWLQGLAEAPGVLSPADEMLLTALASGGAEAAEEVTARYPELGPGIAMLRATEAFRFMDTAYDGRIGARPRPDVLSVSALETLARCPLQYFFDRVLRVRELDAPATFLEVEPREIGLAIHELLEKTYSTLIHEGLFAAGDSERAAQRAVELLQDKRTRLFGDLSEKLSRRVPVLWEHFRRSWLTSLEAFVRNDLARLIDNGWEPVDLERDVSQVLDFGEDTHQRIRGRFDRQLASDAGTLVGDYKTSRNPAARAKPIKMLKGEALQVPLYWKMAGEQATVELLGVGPRVLPDSDVHYAEFKGFASPEQSRGFDETVRVLLELLGAGSFPLHSENHCQWCIYAQACRRVHPPTVAREENAVDARDYRSLSRKQTRRPLLADVRGTS